MKHRGESHFYPESLISLVFYKDRKTNLSHHNVLTLFDELVLGLHNGLQELEILNMSTMSLSAVDKVLNHSLVNLTAQLEVIHKDVLHGDCLQDLKVGRQKGQLVKTNTDK